MIEGVVLWLMSAEGLSVLAVRMLAVRMLAVHMLTVRVLAVRKRGRDARLTAGRLDTYAWAWAPSF